MNRKSVRRLFVIISSLLFLSLLTACSGSSSNRITGIFGMNFGTNFAPAQRLGTPETSIDPCYKFIPNKPNDRLTDYCVKTTPVSSLVYAVEARSNFSSYAACSDTEKSLINLIESKHGKGEKFFNVLDDGSIYSGMRLTKNNKMIVILSYHEKGSSGTHGLTLSYSDKRLESLANKEKL